MKPDMAIIGRPGPTSTRPITGNTCRWFRTDDVLAALEKQPSELVAALSARKEADGDFRYAPGKWTVKESLGMSSMPSAFSVTGPCASRATIKLRWRVSSRMIM